MTRTSSTTARRTTRLDKENEPPHERRPPRKYVDGDGLFVRKDKGSMSLCEYACFRGRINKIYYNWVCSIVRDALVKAGITTPDPINLYGRHAEVNQTWAPEYHTPHEFNLKDAFSLIQAQTQTNTTVWGRLGPAKQREIVKYIRERTAFLRVTSGDWLYEELVIDVLANVRAAYQLQYDREACRLAGIMGWLSRADITRLRNELGVGSALKASELVLSESDQDPGALSEEDVLENRNRVLLSMPPKRAAQASTSQLFGASS